MASAFLRKYALVTAVDLIQHKKLNFRNFYESNLTEARFNSVPFYSNNYGKSLLNSCIPLHQLYLRHTLVILRYSASSDVTI